MSRWKSNFDSQQANQRIQNSVTLLTSAKIEGLSPQDLAEYSRLLKVLNVLAMRLSKLDPELFGMSTWGSFSSWFSNAENEIKAFGQNRNVGHLQNANTSVDNVLNVLRPLDTGATVEEFKSIADANAVFQQKIVEELQRVKARGDEVKAQLDSLSNAIGQGKTRLEENDKAISQQKTRLDQSIAEYQKQFSEAQEKRTKDFAEVQKKNSDEFLKQGKLFETQFADTGTQRKQEYETFFTTVRKRSDEHADFLQKREEEVKRIFNVIGNVAVAGDYKNTAERERRVANWLRGIALGLMLAMAAVAAATFLHSLSDKQIDWKLFGFRLGTTLILAVPALYAAQESAKHREREKLNRKLHLELSAIDAYLELLPIDQRQQIKAKLTERFFGQSEAKEKDEPVTKHELFELFSKVLQTLTKPK